MHEPSVGKYYKSVNGNGDSTTWRTSKDACCSEGATLVGIRNEGRESCWGGWGGWDGCLNKLKWDSDKNVLSTWPFKNYKRPNYTQVSWLV